MLSVSRSRRSGGTPVSGRQSARLGGRCAWGRSCSVRSLRSFRSFRRSQPLTAIRGIAPGWAAVSLAIAAAFISLDRFFGFSSGWMRFMEAELQLTRLRHTFEYAWNDLRATSQDPPDDAELAAYLKLAEEFVLAVDGIVAQETAGWITEFRGGLAHTEQGLRESRP